MKKRTILAAIVVLTIACNNKKTMSSLPELTPCMEEFKTNPHASKVLAIFNNGEWVYSFRYYPESLNSKLEKAEFYNKDCVLVCSHYKDNPTSTNCPETPFSAWEIIWEK